MINPMDDDLKTMLSLLLTKVEAIDAKVGALDAKVGALDAKVDALAREVESVKHTAGVQYYKVIGRIEQVASMLAEHMVDHHPSVVERKTA